MRPRVVTVAMLALALVSACDTTTITPGPSPLPTVSLSPAPPRQRLADPLVVWNSTEISVSVLIDGEAFLTADAGAVVRVPGANLPPLPFGVEARASDGRLLASGSVDGPFLIRVGLTCGVLDLWSTSIQPIGPRPNPADDIEC